MRWSEIVPVEMKSPKDSDLRVKVGQNTLYISRVQAWYISRVTHMSTGLGTSPLVF